MANATKVLKKRAERKCAGSEEKDGALEQEQERGRESEGGRKRRRRAARENSREVRVKRLNAGKPMTRRRMCGTDEGTVSLRRRD